MLELIKKTINNKHMRGEKNQEIETFESFAPKQSRKKADSLNLTNGHFLDVGA